MDISVCTDCEYKAIVYFLHTSKYNIPMYIYIYMYVYMYIWVYIYMHI